MFKKEITSEHDTHSSEETCNLGFQSAKQELMKDIGQEARVFALQGELGSGKTTFVQGFAQGLGIKEKVLSPTFVIMKSYAIPASNKTFYHIDCYRVERPKDLLELGWQEIAQNPNNIILLEWPERVEDILPVDKREVSFVSVGKTERKVVMKL